MTSRQQPSMHLESVLLWQRKIPIAVDGEIRRGTDISKALALGDCFYFVGRVPIWGLAVSQLLE